MLTGIGKGVRSDKNWREAAEVGCKIYNQSVESVDKACQIMLSEAAGPEVLPEVLPPTIDVFQYQMKRVHFKTMVWKQANVSVQVVPHPDQTCWEL